MLIVAGLLGFISLCFALLATVVLPREAQMGRSLLNLGGPDPQAMPVAVDMEGSFQQRVGAAALLRLGQLLHKLTPAGMTRTIAMKLERAGNPGGVTVVHFLGLQACSVCAFAAGAILFHGSGLLSPLLSLLVSGLILLVGFILPDSWLQGRITRREKDIRRALPDSIDILVACAEAGLSLDQGLSELISRRRGPLSDEFDRVLREIAVGKARAQAWRDMAERSGSQSVKGFAAAIYQAEELGTSISTVMRVQSETCRSQRSQEIRTLAGKLPVKMLFPLIFFIFPALFTVVLGPAMVSIYQAITFMK